MNWVKFIKRTSFVFAVIALLVGVAGKYESAFLLMFSAWVFGRLHAWLLGVGLEKAFKDHERKNELIIDQADFIKKQADALDLYGDQTLIDPTYDTF